MEGYKIKSHRPSNRSLFGVGSYNRLSPAASTSDSTISGFLNSLHDSKEELDSFIPDDVVSQPMIICIASGYANDISESELKNVIRKSDGRKYIHFHSLRLGSLDVWKDSCELKLNLNNLKMPILTAVRWFLDQI